MKEDLKRAARSYPPRADALERLLRRRDRRRVVNRVVTAGVALTVGLLAVGLLFAAFRDGRVRPPASGLGGDQVTNGRISFTRRLPTEWNLFTVNPDGSEEQHVTHGVRDYSSSWSPDGTRIVVDRETGLTVMDADGSNAVVISDARGSFPSWSPDGTKILFVGDGADSQTVVGDGFAARAMHLFVVNADGTDPHQLTTGSYVDGRGTWSPDGSHIVFDRFGASESGLYVMDAVGSDPVLLVPGQEHMPYGPAWSPDGSRIAFVMNAQHGASIYVMNADGSGIVQLTGGAPYFDTAPAWSPDGTLIAFSREIGGDHYVTGDIYVMRVDGTDVTQLTNTPDEDEQVPSWGTAPVLASSS